MIEGSSYTSGPEGGLLDPENCYSRLSHITERILKEIEEAEKKRIPAGNIFNMIEEEEKNAFAFLLEMSKKGFVTPGILDNIGGSSKIGSIEIPHSTIIEALFTYDQNLGFEGFRKKLAELVRNDSLKNIGLEDVLPAIKAASEAFQKKLSSITWKEHR